jgi:uncharacterized protein with PQ loop repeat
MNYILINVIGYTGLFLSLIYRIPQIYKLYITKSGNDLSTVTFIICNLSYILYIIYGYLVYDFVIIIGTILSLIINSIVWIMVSYYNKKIINDNTIEIKLVIKIEI